MGRAGGRAPRLGGGWRARAGAAQGGQLLRLLQCVRTHHLARGVLGGAMATFKKPKTFNLANRVAPSPSRKGAMNQDLGFSGNGKQNTTS